MTLFYVMCIRCTSELQYGRVYEGNHDDVRWYVLYAIGSWESELDRWWAGIHVGRGTIVYGGLLVLAGNFGRLRLRRVSGLLEALSAWHASNEHSPQYYQW